MNYEGQILDITSDKDCIYVTVKNTGTKTWYPHEYGGLTPAIGLRIEVDGEWLGGPIVFEHVQPMETYTFIYAIANLGDITGIHNLTLSLETSDERTNLNQTISDKVTKQIDLGENEITTATALVVNAEGNLT